MRAGNFRGRERKKEKKERVTRDGLSTGLDFTDERQDSVLRSRSNYDLWIQLKKKKKESEASAVKSLICLNDKLVDLF